MAASSHLNCWEVTQCGRDVFSSQRKGSVCPVSITTCHHGRNAGVNGGRCCWAVTGTYCASRLTPTKEEQGSVRYKETHCPGCAFRRMVEQEHAPRLAARIPLQVRASVPAPR